MKNPFRLSQEFVSTVDQWSGVVGAPEPQNRKKLRIDMFENRFVERYLSQAHPAFPGLWTFPFAAYALHRALAVDGLTLGTTATLFALGVLGWSLFEYNAHRFIFHFRPGTNRPLRYITFLFHGYHHEFPQDPMRLVAPPLLAAWALSVFTVVYASLTGWAYTWPLLAGTVIGYLAYDWVHYYTHHFHPRRGIGATLRRLHFIHHYNNPDANHGISSPVWDLIFGTFQAHRSGPIGVQHEQHEQQDRDTSLAS